MADITEQIARSLHAEFLRPESRLNGVESLDFDRSESKPILMEVAAKVRSIATDPASPFNPLPSSNDIAAERLAASPEAFREPGNHRFRKKYRKLMPEEEILADAIKDKAGELADLFDKVKALAMQNGNGSVGREIALAHTHLEDAIMRGIRGLTA